MPGFAFLFTWLANSAALPGSNDGTEEQFWASTMMTLMDIGKPKRWVALSNNPKMPLRVLWHDWCAWAYEQSSDSISCMHGGTERESSALKLSGLTQNPNHWRFCCLPDCAEPPPGGPPLLPKRCG